MLIIEQELSDKISRGEVFFFVGSGISYHSNIPSAGQVLYETAKCVLPTSEEYFEGNQRIIDTPLEYNIQPEVFYETLINITGHTEVLGFWKSVAKTNFENHNLPYLSNLNHRFIVDYSFKNHLPIFTVNFDTLFESTCELFGITYEVIIPEIGKHREYAKLIDENRDKLYIFKLHGSIEIDGQYSLDTLCVTMTKISCPDLGIVKLIHELCTNKHITFLGYSGRDIDYFPKIKLLSKEKRPYWLNPKNQQGNGLYEDTQKNCRHIDAVEINRMPIDFFSKIKNVKKNDDSSVDNLSLKNIFWQLSEDFKNDIKLTEEVKILLHSALNLKLSAYKYSYEILAKLALNHNLPPRQHIILLLNLSGSCHALSKFETLGKLSRLVSKISLQDPTFKPFHINAQCNIAESNRMLIANIEGEFDLFSTLKTIVLFFWIAVRIRRPVNKLKKIFPLLNSEEIRAIHVSIEHRIRFLAIIQGGLLPLSRKLVEYNLIFLSAGIKKKLEKLWEKLNKSSTKYGYSEGVANVVKYITRVDFDRRFINEGERIFDLTKSTTGKELLKKNHAEYYFSLANNSKDESDKIANLEQARINYITFYQGGINNHNYLNAVKGLLGLANTNVLLGKQPLTQQEYQLFQNSIGKVEGKSWKKLFKKKLKALKLDMYS